jgi:hypothetical protein
LGPAAPLYDQMIGDDTLGSRQIRRAERSIRAAHKAPWCREDPVQIHRAAQTYSAQNIRNRIHEQLAWQAASRATAKDAGHFDIG